MGNSDTEHNEIAEKKENSVERKKKMRHRIRILATVTMISVVITFTAIISSVLIWLYYNHQGTSVVEIADAQDEQLEEKVYTQSEVDVLVDEAKQEGEDQASQSILERIENQLENGISVMGLIRSLYPEKVVLYDSNKYFFFPIDTTLKTNTYVDENFQTDENGWVSYQEDGNTVTHAGIDVSVFQGEIDWDAVKASGIEYAIIRAGIRGYSTGKIVPDENCQANIEGALASGLKVGVYFFSQAISDDEAIEEAQCVLDLIEDYQITYPVYLDIEQVDSSNCRTSDLSVAERTTYAKTFLETIQAAGYKPGLYGNLKTFTLLLDEGELEDYPKWFASYSLPVYYPYEYTSLQYTEKGKIEGIDENVDLNISFEDYSDEE